MLVQRAKKKYIVNKSTSCKKDLDKADTMDSSPWIQGFSNRKCVFLLIVIAGSVEKCFKCSIFYSFSHPPIMSVLCRKSHQAQGMPDSI